MMRKIIHIDEEKCSGCGLCAEACHEGAIEKVNGKAKLMREDFCDGFGDCLPNCPTGAITFEEREAPAYDEAAVKASKEHPATDRRPPQDRCGLRLHGVSRRYARLRRLPGHALPEREQRVLAQVPERRINYHSRHGRESRLPTPRQEWRSDVSRCSPWTS